MAHRVLQAIETHGSPLRVTAAALALAAVLVSAAAGSGEVPTRGAKEFLAASLERDRQALNDVRTADGVSAARTRMRISRADLGAALDTLGAAELPAETTASIQELLVSAAGLKGRALAGSRARLAAAVTAALAQETRAAGLLGDAPRAPTVAELPIPGSGLGAFDMTLGPDGRSVWVSGPDAGRIVQYRSLALGTVPVVFRLPPGSSPRGIVFGPDGALYVAETGTKTGGSAIARLDSDGQVRQFFLPRATSGPWGIAVGPDRKLWFTEVTSGRIGCLDPVSGKITESPLPTPNSQPRGITLGADGALWGTEAGANRIFRITARGEMTEIPIPTPGSESVEIAPGRGGFLWVSELSGGKLLRVSRTGKMREFPLPAGARPYGVTSAPDGNVWFADRGRNRIGLITPAGRVFEYVIPTANAQPTAILPLGIGQFAFTELGSNQVGTLRFVNG
jgi:virginiamycin B lyase